MPAKLISDFRAGLETARKAIDEISLEAAAGEVRIVGEYSTIFDFAAAVAIGNRNRDRFEKFSLTDSRKGKAGAVSGMNRVRLPEV